MIVSTSTSDGKTNQNKAQTKSRHHRKPVNRATANGGTWIKDANDGVWQRTTKKKSKKKEGRQETAQSEENFCRFSESCHDQIWSISEVIGRWLATYFRGDWWVIGGDWRWLAMIGSTLHPRNRKWAVCVWWLSFTLPPSSLSLRAPSLFPYRIRVCSVFSLCLVFSFLYFFHRWQRF